MKRQFKIPKLELMDLCSKWLEKCTIQPVIFSTIQLARELIDKYDFQLFDSIIISAALEANCDIIYSEDMQNGLVVENVLTIIDPFI